jgi:hypothetical protein
MVPFKILYTIGAQPVVSDTGDYSGPGAKPAKGRKRRSDLSPALPAWVSGGHQRIGCGQSVNPEQEINGREIFNPYNIKIHDTIVSAGMCAAPH